MHEVWALELSPSQLFFKQQQQGPSKCRGAICLPIFVGFGISFKIKGVDMDSWVSYDFSVDGKKSRWPEVRSLDG